MIGRDNIVLKVTVCVSINLSDTHTMGVRTKLHYNLRESFQLGLYLKPKNFHATLQVIT